MCDKSFTWLRNGIIVIALVLGFILVSIVLILQGINAEYSIVAGLGLALISLGWTLLANQIHSSQTSPQPIITNDITLILERIEDKIDKKNWGVNDKSISKMDNFNEICTELKIIYDKLATADVINKELNDNPSKMNTALLFQILKFHKDKLEGERDFAYSNLFLVYAAFCFSLVAVFTAIDKMWGLLSLIAAIIFMLIFALFMKYSKKNRLEGV